MYEFLAAMLNQCQNFNGFVKGQKNSLQMSYFASSQKAIDGSYGKELKVFSLSVLIAVMNLR